MIVYTHFWEIIFPDYCNLLADIFNEPNLVVLQESNKIR